MRASAVYESYLSLLQPQLCMVRHAFSLFVSFQWLDKVALHDLVLRIFAAYWCLPWALSSIVSVNQRFASPTQSIGLVSCRELFVCAYPQLCIFAGFFGFKRFPNLCPDAGYCADAYQIFHRSPVRFLSLRRFEQLFKRVCPTRTKMHVTRKTLILVII